MKKNQSKKQFFQLIHKLKQSHLNMVDTLDLLRWVKKKEK